MLWRMRVAVMVSAVKLPLLMHLTVAADSPGYTLSAEPTGSRVMTPVSPPQLATLHSSPTSASERILQEGAPSEAPTRRPTPAPTYVIAPVEPDRCRQSSCCKEGECYFPMEQRCRYS